MDSVDKLIEDGIIIVKDYYEDRIDKDMNTGEEKLIRSFYKKYYDTRKFIKTFNPIIDKLVKDFVGDPKAQFIFILMSIVEDNKEKIDINLSYSEFSKICNKHNVKKWTRSQLSNCLKWMTDKGYLNKLEGSMFRINYKYFYNGSLLNPLGLSKPVKQFEE